MSGALLYGMLAGRPPFQGTAETVMYKVMNDQPTPPSLVSEDCVLSYGVRSRRTGKLPADFKFDRIEANERR